MSTDAKWLSEVQRYAWTEHGMFDGRVSRIYMRDARTPKQYVDEADYAALAERLKACEATVDKLRGRRLDLIEYLRDIERDLATVTQERDALSQLEMTHRATCHEVIGQRDKLKAALERVVDIAKTPLLPIQEAYYLMRDEAQAALTETPGHRGGYAATENE